LTLFRPGTGEVRAKPVERTPNTVLHPWLEEELAAILAELPTTTPGTVPLGEEHDWSHWGYDAAMFARLTGPPPAIRAILIWDNLAGHKSEAIVTWCLERGILLLYTPLAGSWLNMAESVQRVLIRRALAGQHPHSVEELLEWLAAVVRGWNAAPTPFVWGGKRAARRLRARARRHRVGGSGAHTRCPLARRQPSLLERSLNGNIHVN
jgi:hypothetical protein